MGVSEPSLFAMFLEGGLLGMLGLLCAALGVVMAIVLTVTRRPGPAILFAVFTVAPFILGVINWQIGLATTEEAILASGEDPDSPNAEWGRQEAFKAFQAGVFQTAFPVVAVILCLPFALRKKKTDVRDIIQ